MPTEKWFPTPIYYNIIDNVDEVQKELLSLVDKTTFEKSNKPDWDKNSATFSNGYNEGENMLEAYKPPLFLNELYKNINMFFNDLRFCPKMANVDLIIKESWFTRTQKNEYHHRHLHACSEMSGVYYIKTTGDEGSINFYPPTSIMFASRIFVNEAVQIVHKPQVGKLLLWPSLVEHGVVSNQTDNDRISLSFNISLRDKL
jgi:uncharacterized protein (TIGR02466 family)